MSSIKRFLKLFSCICACFFCAFSDGIAAPAIDFSVTTVSLSADDSIPFNISATGKFIVDCGSDGTLGGGNGNDINGDVITRSVATPTAYTCKYQTAGVKTISFTNYDASMTTYNTGYTVPMGDTFYYPAIDFAPMGSKLQAISGDLSKLFPDSSNAATHPRFYGTFSGNTTLESLPDDLFKSYTGGVDQMFRATFINCSGLKSIPEKLFVAVTTGAFMMFAETFKGCTSLAKLPQNLFSGITTAPSSMFAYTFEDCTGLTQIPDGFFSSVTSSTNAFRGTFMGCTGLTALPQNLFAGLTAGTDNFRGTFDGCTHLSGFIPPSMFKGLIGSGSPGSMTGTFDNTGLLTSCPANYHQFITGYESGWSGKVSCEGDSFTVTYNCGDGPGNAPSVTPAVYGASFTPASNTCSAPTGYTFKGWKVSGTNDIKSAGSSFTWNYAENKTLTAQYQQQSFNIVTMPVTAGDTFTFTLSAAGTFTVNCGSGGTLSGTGVSGTTINHTSNTNNDTYTCTYSTNGNSKTIQISGVATGYSNNGSIPAIKFTTPTLIKSMTGYLSTIFPRSGAGVPRFIGTFEGATNLTAVPNTLFATYTSGSQYMFQSTFGGCTSLTTLPSGLFSAISVTGNDGAYMFYKTFENCTGLTTLPSGLFPTNATGGQSMFHSTFAGCTSLATLPSGLFSSISTSASTLFYRTFYGCSALTSIPADTFSFNGNNVLGKSMMFQSTFEGCSGLAPTAANSNTPIPATLFSHVTSGDYQMFSRTFYGCTGLTTLPSGLFSSVASGGNSMFSSTFYGCTGLTSLPSGLFSSVATSAQYLFQKTFYGCTGLTSIPADTFSFGGNDVSGQERMFEETFRGCTGLAPTVANSNTPIPATLFSHVISSAPQMFLAVFYGCSGLTSIPAGLFSFGNHNVSGQSGMFGSAFQGCTGLVSIPENLFSRITSSANGMFSGTFYSCTGLTSLPQHLFPNITTAADNMFKSMFHGCNHLNGGGDSTLNFIPPTLFEGLIGNNSPTATSMMTNIFAGASLRTQCPADYYQYTTGYESDWGSKVSCTPCPTGSHSPAGSTLASQCVVSYSITYYDEDCETELTGLSPASYTVEDTVALPSLTRTGYYNSAWDGGGSTYLTGWEPGTRTGDKSFCINWQPKTWMLQYDCGSLPSGATSSFVSGGTAPTNLLLTYDASYTLADNAGTCQLPGYTFNGWSCNNGLDGSLVNEQPASGTWNIVPSTVTVSCSALWRKNNLGLSWYDSDGNGLNGASNSCQYDGTVATLPTAPTINGYHFKKWNIRENALSNVNTSTNATDGYAINSSVGENRCDHITSAVGGENMSCSTSVFSDLGTYGWKTIFGYGTVYGTSLCSVTNGINTPTVAGNPSSTAGKYCWCRVTAFSPTGGSFQTGFSSDWYVVDNPTFDSVGSCQGRCAATCAIKVFGNSAARSRLFGQ